MGQSHGAREAHGRVQAPWKFSAGLASVIDQWVASNVVRPCLVAERPVPGREGKYRDFPTGLDSRITNALRARGINSLYTHQAAAFEAAQTHKAVVVSTPTASGKSFCFHLPVLQRLGSDESARAIYLYPTKALSRDQEASLRTFMGEAGLQTPAIVYDGDTPGDARRTARERTRIMLTNPDMLHTGVLPHHTSWARTFQNLTHVVVDEMHMYKGVFGSHVSHVLQRLRRIARFHGSDPVFIGATATIGNPKEHAARLFGLPEEDVALVGADENGAPNGPRRVFLYNPPVVNAELGMRASYVKQAVMLAADLVKARVPTLIFGHSRNNVEVMLRYLRDRVADQVSADRIQGYRGGYLPETRREIERRLRAGELSCVVATNALELGIDIGELDAVICAGYPGSVAATWQRFGRAGRRGTESAAILVTSSAPLDQYIARDPDYLFGAPVEEARIDPHNAEILIQHLKCAAFELPFKRGEPYAGLPADDTKEALTFLQHHKVLHEENGTFHWAADSYPANNVSLRSVGWDNVVIIDAEHDTTLAEIDWRGAHTMVHEQAIYQHDGECYQVEKFDYENHKAFVRKVKPDYYTDAMTYTQVAVLEQELTAPLPTRDAEAWDTGWGEVAVVEKVVGYKKIKFYTHENAGYGDVHLPEMQMHTTSFWLTVPESRLVALKQGRTAGIDALRGVGIALETVGTLILMCDPRDIGATLGDTAPDRSEAEGETRPEGTPPLEDATLAAKAAKAAGNEKPRVPTVPMRVRGGARPGYNPTLFLYEHVPGGSGLAERMYELAPSLLQRAHDLIATCPCDGGCPACVGPSDPLGYDLGGTRKSVALELLRGLSNVTFDPHATPQTRPSGLVRHADPHESIEH